MLPRRPLLLALAALPLLPPGLAKATPGAAAFRLNALFDRFFDQQLRRNPEQATSLGLDTGARAPLKSRLSDVSLAAAAQDKMLDRARLRALQAIDRRRLHGIDAANYDTILFILQGQVEAERAIPYAAGGVQSPYVLSQLQGSYRDIPDFLDSSHGIANQADAEAYLARLAALPRAMDQELEQFRHDAAHGVTPPDFVLDRTLAQMQSFLDTPADQAVLVSSLVRRAHAAGLATDYRTPAAARYTHHILPALRRQSDALRAARATASHAAGVGSLPQGAAFYRLALKSYTTATLTPAALHQTGLDLVADYSAKLDAALQAQGAHTGTPGVRVAALTTAPAQLYPNTDSGKAALVADLNSKVAAVQAKLPQWFGTLPKARVEIRRVPPPIEAGAPMGYYQPGSIDGSRAGTYYINLRDTAELPKLGLPTLTFHESIPGHHLQLTLAQETPGLPMLRKAIFFSGYGEGWAHYAEQLAAEMGLYDNDPLGHIGQLQGALWRAVRLVVDTGLHDQGWSRERAIAYYVDALGSKPSAAATEIERYCVWPGQACAYLVGKLTWLRLRERAKTALGPKFDIKKFHDAGLLSGALPLDVLEQVIDNYIETTRGEGLCPSTPLRACP